MVLIKKSTKVTKFKIRRGRYFYTFKADKPNVIQAIEAGLGKDVEKVEIKKRRIIAKKNKKWSQSLFKPNKLLNIKQLEQISQYENNYESKFHS